MVNYPEAWLWMGPAISMALPKPVAVRLACQFGCGTVFELAEASGVYTEKILHNFTGDPDGQSPGSLSMDASGNLYGTTEFGGTAKSPSFCKAGCGTVFELTNNSGSYTYSVLFSFSIAGFYGINPGGKLVVDSSGNVLALLLRAVVPRPAPRPRVRDCLRAGQLFRELCTQGVVQLRGRSGW